jgi:hypothetical protein
MVQVHCDEDLASHIDRESCVSYQAEHKLRSEALTAVHTGNHGGDCRGVPSVGL